VNTGLRAPFFEIGPKNLLRRTELEQLARAAGRACSEYDVDVVLTVPTSMVAPIAELRTGVQVFAQNMDTDTLGASVGRVTAESLVDAGAAGVMLNHDSNPLTEEELLLAVRRAQETGLQTMVCAGSASDALRYTDLRPTAVLLEPAALIGTTGGGARGWIRPTNAAMRGVDPDVLAMHAGGVASPSIARRIMAAGADGTGSTSGVLTADNPLAAARSFIAAARAGWDDAHASLSTPTGA
jgi:triosephosphate isomerase